MRHVINAPVLRFLSFTLFMFFAVYYGAGYEVLAYVLAALIFGTAVVAFYSWSLTFIDAAKDGGRKGEAIIALVLMGICVFGVYQRIWSVWGVSTQWGGPDKWMLTSIIGLGPALILWWILMGILFAPARASEAIANKSPIYWGAALFISGLFLGVVLTIAWVRGSEEQTEPPQVYLQSMPPAPVCSDTQPVLVRAYCRALPGGGIVPAKRDGAT